MVLQIYTLLGMYKNKYKEEFSNLPRIYYSQDVILKIENKIKTIKEFEP